VQSSQRLKNTYLGVTLLHPLSILFIGIAFLFAPTMMSISAQPVEERTYSFELSPSTPAIYDSAGNFNSRTVEGRQITISTAFSSNIDNVSMPLVSIIEIRNQIGQTVFLAWQAGNMTRSENFISSVSWLAKGNGTFVVRNFAISNFTEPVILSIIQQNYLTVYSCPDGTESCAVVSIAIARYSRPMGDEVFVDNQTLSNYPAIFAAVQKADIIYEEYSRICTETPYRCNSGMPPPNNSYTGDILESEAVKALSQLPFKEIGPPGKTHGQYHGLHISYMQKYFGISIVGIGTP
jgi:hypothetical protein